MADFTSILSATMPIQNLVFSHILAYCYVINYVHGRNNDYRHVIFKGQHLLNEHFVTDLLFKQNEIERFSGRMCTPKCSTVSHFSCLEVNPLIIT